MKRSPEDLWQEACGGTAYPRSVPFKQGFFAALVLRMGHGRMACPYPAGQTEADAWWAGHDAGKAAWAAENGQGLSAPEGKGSATDKAQRLAGQILTRLDILKTEQDQELVGVLLEEIRSMLEEILGL